MSVWCRTGEGFGSSVEWCEPGEEVIEFAESVNPDGEPGLRMESGGHGFAGFHRPTGIYWRYKDEGDLGGGEHCVQILAIVSMVCASGDCKRAECHRCFPRSGCDHHRPCVEYNR